ncbi:MAG: hypothetical protein NT128_01120 [Proteobacteria bacterium]|nr:hypothetical protein [Pseudomonadota bacterium]
MKKLHLMLVGFFIIACPKSTYGAALPEDDSLKWINHFVILRNKYKNLMVAPPEVYKERIHAALQRALRISNLEEDGRQERFRAVIKDEFDSEQFVGKNINPAFRYLEPQKEFMKPTLSAALESVLVPLPHELNNLILEFSIWSERPIKPIP